MVAGGVGGSLSIKKNSLNFQAKVWWTLVRHRLFPNLLDNVMGSNKAALITGMMSSYEINLAKWIA